MGNRFDSRSKEKFKEEIKLSHLIECDITIRLCILAYQETGIFPTLVPCGTDYTGKFVENPKDVKIDPDYIIAGKHVEITRSNTYCSRAFHEKVKKVDLCIAKGYNMVFVNRYHPIESSEFVWMDSKLLSELTQRSIKKFGKSRSPYGMGKDSYRYETSWFKGLWQTLPIIDPKIILPKQYNDILIALGQ